MLGYVLIGVNDLERATEFYDGLLGVVGGQRIFELARGFMYGWGPDKPMIGITRPLDGKPATVGNGSMVSLAAGSRDQVKAVYDKALAIGGTDEGAPGLRGEEGEHAFYAAYFRDPDGNKLCAFHIGPA